MKLHKLLAFSLFGLALTACSDDDNDFNSAADVTVNMGQTEMTVSKQFNGTYYNIPVVVSGEANGPVQVTVEVSEVSENPAKEGEDYVITQKTIIIPADKQTGNIQFYPIFEGTEIINSQFAFTIVKAEGAAIGSDDTTVVTLRVPSFYEKMQGSWTFIGNDDGAETTFALNCYGVGEDEAGFGTDLYFSGWMGYSWVNIMATFDTDETTLSSTLSFELGQKIAEGVNFGSAGVRDVALVSASNGYLVARGTIVATVDPELKTITFDPDAAFLGSLMNNGAPTTSIWFWWDTMSIVR